eukprot:CAMPEP_0194086800 /NCGR_PEP_ID=MMETSP0149-20130528/22483_1 /TAXON_ID=122233 /ORGANISM="Chaetoceros debilis, Strain MM31A-1" /LENGTH=557 /DNA_ID=CAMNT_0038769981 /DNA_START=40 /DNA_END=1710 /DNA_ORIENTATION=+
MNPRTFTNSFFFTRAGAIIPRITGILSALSSALIISIILRSDSKLKNSYHRIMFVMSFWDIISSSAMSLTTILLPADVQSVYPFESKSYGTTATCEAQGFAYLVGSQFVIFSSILLHVYYACILRYKVSKAFFARFIEPAFFIFSVPLCLLSPVLALVYGRINPVPYDSCCASGTYPWTCTLDEDVTCIRGGDVPPQLNTLIKHFFFSLIMFALFVTITIMIIVIRKVKRGERELRNQEKQRRWEEKITEGQSWPANDNDNDENINVELDNDNCNDGDSVAPSEFEIESTAGKPIIVQAYMYVGAFLLTFTFQVLSFVSSQIKAFHVLKLIFQPLQGFFNCIIFIYDKAQHARSIEPRLTWKEAARSAIFEPDKHQGLFMSQIEIVGGKTRQPSTGETPPTPIEWQMNRKGILLSPNKPDNSPLVACAGSGGLMFSQSVEEVENYESNEVFPLANLTSLLVDAPDVNLMSLMVDTPDDEYMVKSESRGSENEINTLQDDLRGFSVSHSNIESMSPEDSINIHDSLRYLYHTDDGDAEAQIESDNADSIDSRLNEQEN